MNQNQTVQFRIQPALDDLSTLDPKGENYLFEIGAGPNYPITSIPNRPWLWPSGTTPTSFTVQSITMLSSPRVIDWVHSNVQWVQVSAVTTVNGVETVLSGYLTLKNLSGVQILTPAGQCQLGNAPVPDVGIPTVAPRNFNMPAMQSLFQFVPPSVMGSCGFHDGTLRPCTPNQATPEISTLDVVPRNIEPCIESRPLVVAPGNPNSPLDRIRECDPNPANVVSSNTRIPVYSPVSGCAIRVPNSPTDIVIEMDHDNTGYTNGCSRATIENQVPRYQLVLSHVINTTATDANYLTVQPGTLIGYMCTRTDWLQASACGNVSELSLSPVHIAAQLRKNLEPYGLA